MGTISRFANPRLKISQCHLSMDYGQRPACFRHRPLAIACRSPPDYQQGELVRIMYIHVPAAWTGMQLYESTAIASAVGLVWRHTLTDGFA